MELIGKQGRHTVFFFWFWPLAAILYIPKLKKNKEIRILLGAVGLVAKCSSDCTCNGINLLCVLYLSLLQGYLGQTYPTLWHWYIDCIVLYHIVSYRIALYPLTPPGKERCVMEAIVYCVLPSCSKRDTSCSTLEKEYFKRQLTICNLVSNTCWYDQLCSRFWTSRFMFSELSTQRRNSL